MSSAAFSHLSPGFLWSGRGGASLVAAGIGWHRGLSKGGPTVEPQPWGAVGFHGVGSVCRPLPGTASQPLARGHTEGFSPVLALSASSLLLPGAAVSPCSPSPVPHSPPSWCHSPSTASTRPVSGVGRRKGSLFPLC